MESTCIDLFVKSRRNRVFWFVQIKFFLYCIPSQHAPQQHTNHLHLVTVIYKGHHDSLWVSFQAVQFSPAPPPQALWYCPLIPSREHCSHIQMLNLYLGTPTSSMHSPFSQLLPFTKALPRLPEHSPTHSGTPPSFISSSSAASCFS